MKPQGVIGVAALGIILGIGGAIMLFAWRLSAGLDPMASGIIVGIFITFLGVGLILVPTFIMLMRSREADKQEYMAMLGKSRSGPLHFNMAEPREVPPFLNAPAPFALMEDWQKENQDV